MRGRVAAAAMVLLTSAATLFSQGQGGGFVAYPERRPGDPAAIERGRAAYGVNCVFCHGIDARGGDDGGPNLLRSSLVLEDVKGERIGSVLRAGRPGMPPFQFTDAQVADLAEFLHSFLVSSRTGPSKIDILTGDTEKGKAYVVAKCASCHTTAALTAFADKLDGPKMRVEAQVPDDGQHRTRYRAIDDRRRLAVRGRRLRELRCV